MPDKKDATTAISDEIRDEITDGYTVGLIYTKPTHL